MLSALVVPVPEAAVVEPWLERTVAHKPSAGVPAHVTVLFPFAPAEEIEYAFRDELRHLFAATAPFEFALARTARFPTTLWLAPEPAAPFVELTRAVVERWPAYPPYGAEFDEIVPHLTVAQGEAELLDLAEAEVAPSLPLAARATEVVLLEAVERFGQRWHTAARFPLGIV